jgi:hypothetical protein
MQPSALSSNERFRTGQSVAAAFDGFERRDEAAVPEQALPSNRMRQEKAGTRNPFVTIDQETGGIMGSTSCMDDEREEASPLPDSNLIVL